METHQIHCASSCRITQERMKDEGPRGEVLLIGIGTDIIDENEQCVERIRSQSQQ
jgi:hypothetical protein